MKLSNNQQEFRRKKLKELYCLKGIIECELKLKPKEGYPEKCWRNASLGFAHKDKRWKYIRRPEDLWTFKETILCCVICHQKIECDRLLTLSFFKRLRNN